MRKPELLETRDVDLSDIHIEARLRDVNPVAVQSLMASIEEIGLKDHIHLRKVRLRKQHDKGVPVETGTVLRLMAGAHRVDAFHQLGLEAIPAKVWDCTDDYAKLIEIDDNLAHNSLNPLDMARFLASRKAVYEEMYPLTKNGAKGLAVVNGNQTDTMSIWSFVASTAEKTNQSERNVRRWVAAGAALDDDMYRQLSAAPKPVSYADLQTIAKATPDERPIICRDLSLGKVKSAKEVLDRRKHPGAKAGTPADKELGKLDDAWARASKAAKRRFVNAHAAELRDLLGVEQWKDEDTGLSFASRRDV